MSANELSVEIWVHIAASAHSLEDVWSLTSTCRTSAQARRDPALPAGWLLAQKGGTQALWSAVKSPIQPDAWAAAIVAKLIQLGGDVNDASGSASDLGDDVVHEFWLNEGEGGVTLTMCAAGGSGGNVEVVTALLQGGADLNAAADDSRCTALMLAASRGHAAVVEALLAGGAEVDAANQTYTTALTYSIETGHAAVVQALLSAGADPNTANWDGFTPLMSACSQGHEVVEMLLMAGADVDTVGEIASCCRIGGAGYTLDAGFDGGALVMAAAGGYAAVVAALLAAGANPDTATPAGWTALMFAAYGGHVYVVEDLLEAGADHSAADDQGRTALMFAADRGHVCVVEDLLEAGADHSAADDQGRTALMFAADRGHSVVVAALLAAAVDAAAVVLREA